MSSGQLVSCMQLPASLDPMLTMANHPQQQHPTMWLQQQQHDQQPVALPQGCVIQQAVDTSLWGMPQQPQGTDAPQPNQARTGSMDVGKLSAVLQDILVTLQPAASQAVSTGINSSAPLVLQLGPASSQSQMAVVNMAAGPVQQQQQPMQQVFTNSAGEQVLLAGGGGVQATTQQQIPVSASGSGEVQVLLQQLQEALQRVPGDTAAAAVQQMLMCVQPSQSQALQQPATTLLVPEGAVVTSSYMVAQPTHSFPPHMTNSCSTGSSVSGSTSHWQSSDNLCSSGTNSSGYIVHGGPAPPACGSTGMGQGVLHIVSGPQMPQPNLSAAQGGFPHGMAGGTGSNTGQMHRLGGPMPVGPGMVAMHHQQQQPNNSHYMLLGCLPDADHAAGQQGYHQAGRQVPHGRHQPLRGNAPYLQQQQKGRLPPPKQQQPVGFGGPAQGSGPAGVAAAAPGRATDEGSTQQDSCAAGAAASTGPGFSGPAASISLDAGLKQLWTGEQLQAAKGGRLFNIEQRMAWQPVGEPDPGAQDLYDFQKLKHAMQKLDAVHRTRVKLIKRLHAVADYGGCDMKSVYFETRCMIGEMMHNAAAQGRPLEDCRVSGLVRLAVVLQEALEAGPKERGGAAARPVRAAAATTAQPAPAAATAAADGDADAPAGL